MYQELPLTGFKFFNQLTENYTEMVRCMMGLDHSESVREERAVAENVEQTAVLGSSVQVSELDELRRQVQMLTQKIERLEKSKKATNWNKSGKGHWRL